LDCLRGSWILSGLSGHWRLFVLVSCLHIGPISSFGYVCYRLDLTTPSAFQFTLNSRIESQL